MNVLGMGPMELLLILVLALIVFGPGKLPEVMGQVGRAIRDFRRTTSEISGEFTRTIQEEMEETRAAVEGTPSPRIAASTTQAPPVVSPAASLANGTHTATAAPVPDTVVWQAPNEPPRGDPPSTGTQKPPASDPDLRPPY
jgi:TatA/E family protein of Tat protein translocase